MHILSPQTLHFTQKIHQNSRLSNLTPYFKNQIIINSLIESIKKLLTKIGVQ